MPAINLLSSLRSGVAQTLLLRCGALAVFTLAMTVQASAQRPLRRLGDRLRETIQSVQRVPPSVPRVPAPLPPSPGTGSLRVPPGSLPPTPADRAAVPSRSNYNAPQSSLRPAMAPTPRAASPYQMQAPASQASAATPLSSAPGSLSGAARAGGPGSSQATLGITVETPPLRISPGATARAARGAVIVSVHPDSSAESAGLVAGDRIVAVDGRLVEGVEDLVSLLGDLREGDRMGIMYVRDEKLSKTTAVISNARTAPNPGRDIAGNRADTRDYQDAADDNGISVLSGDEETSELPAPAADNARELPTNGGPAGATGMQNLGRMLGGWLGGGTTDAAEAEAARVETPSDVPSLRGESNDDSDLPAPLAAPVGDAEATDDFEPLSAQETDPPSLDGAALDSIEPAARSVQELESDMETLPRPVTPGASGSSSPESNASTAIPRRTDRSVTDPFAAGFAEDSVPAKPSPTVQDQESIPAQRSTAAQQDSVRVLLEEIEKLRLRVRQLESDRPAAAE